MLDAEGLGADVTKRQLAGSKVRGDEVCNGKTGGLCLNVGYKGAVGT